VIKSKKVFTYHLTQRIIKIYHDKEVYEMPRRIIDTCIACGACQAECPVDCISEGDIYLIDEDVCIDCGACEPVCPTDSIIVV
jgi:ferredoxin